MCTGWTFDHVDDNLDLPRLIALSTYWKDAPPMHLMIAAYLGVKPQAKEGAVNSDAELNALLSSLPHEG